MHDISHSETDVSLSPFKPRAAMFSCVLQVWICTGHLQEAEGRKWSPMCPCPCMEALVSEQHRASDLPPSLAHQHKAPSGSFLAHLRFQGCASVVTVCQCSLLFLFLGCAVNRALASPSAAALCAHRSVTVNGVFGSIQPCDTASDKWRCSLTTSRRSLWINFFFLK